MIFENTDTERLIEFGEVSTPHLAELFVAAIKGTHHEQLHYPIASRIMGTYESEIDPADATRICPIS